MDISISQVITQIFAFLIMLWVMRKYAWKPLLDILEERKKKIRAEFDAIESEKQQVAKLADQYRDQLEKIDSEARQKIKEAIKEGRDIADEIQKETRLKAKQILSRVEEETERELSKAKKQLREEVVNIAVSISEKMISEEIDRKKHHQLIEEFVERAKF